VNGRLEIIRRMLIVPQGFCVVAYTDDGKPITGEPDNMYPPSPGDVQGARELLAEYNRLSRALARWIRAAEQL
jgi:hypothetical protein